MGAVVSNTPLWGKDVGIQATKTIYGDRQTNLQIYGGVQQHIGGVIGTQNPQANVGVQFTHFFDKDYRCKLLMLGCNG